MKLIALIASSLEPFPEIYSKMKLMQERIYQKMGIEHYFVEFDKNIIEEYEVIGNNLKIRGEETHVPGILIKTLVALKYIHQNRKYDLVFRTGLSCLFNFPLLLQHLQNITDIDNCCAGVIGKTNYQMASSRGKHLDVPPPIKPYGDIMYVAGGGFFMGKNVVSHLINVPYEPYFNLLDDVCLSKMIEGKFKFIPLNRLDFVNTDHSQTVGGFIQYRAILYISKNEIIGGNPLSKYIKLSTGEINQMQEVVSNGVVISETFLTTLHPLIKEIYFFRPKDEIDRSWDIYWFKKLCKDIYDIDFNDIICDV